MLTIMLIKFSGENFSSETLSYEFDNNFKPVVNPPLVVVMDLPYESGQDIISILFKNRKIYDEVFQAIKIKENSLFLIKDEDGIFPQLNVIFVPTSYLRTREAPWIMLFMTHFTENFLWIGRANSDEFYTMAKALSSSDKSVHLDVLLLVEKDSGYSEVKKISSILDVMVQNKLAASHRVFRFENDFDINQNSLHLKKIAIEVQSKVLQVNLSLESVTMESLFVKQMKVAWSNLFSIPRNEKFLIEFKKILHESTSMLWHFHSLEMKKQTIEQINRFSEGYLAYERPSDSKDFPQLVNNYIAILFEPFPFNSYLIKVKAECEEYAQKLHDAFIKKCIQKFKKHFLENVNRYLQSVDCQDQRLISNLELKIRELFDQFREQVSYIPATFLEPHSQHIKTWENIQARSIKQFYTKTVVTYLCKQFLDREEQKFMNRLSFDFLQKNMYFSTLVEGRLQKFETRFQKHFGSITKLGQNHSINLDDLRDELVKDMLIRFKKQAYEFYLTNRDQIFNNYSLRVNHSEEIEDFIESFIIFLSKKQFFSIYHLDESEFYYFLDESQIDDFRKSLKIFIDYKKDHKLDFIFQEELKMKDKLKDASASSLRKKIRAFGLEKSIDANHGLYIVAGALLIVVLVIENLL